jgi:bacterioferritin-associated ferredoxin
LYICLCNAITERAVRECAENGVCSLEHLANELGVGTGCGRCRDCAADVLRDVHGELAPALSAAAA